VIGFKGSILFFSSEKSPPFIIGSGPSRLQTGLNEQECELSNDSAAALAAVVLSWTGLVLETPTAFVY
jgi:hypothetical protein